MIGISFARLRFIIYRAWRVAVGYAKCDTPTLSYQCRRFQLLLLMEQSVKSVSSRRLAKVKTPC